MTNIYAFHIRQKSIKTLKISMQVKMLSYQGALVHYGSASTKRKNLPKPQNRIHRHQRTELFVKILLIESYLIMVDRDNLSVI